MGMNAQDGSWKLLWVVALTRIKNFEELGN